MPFLLADEMTPDSRAYHTTRALGYTATATGLIYGAIAAHRYIKGEFDTDSTLES